jgi:hypothetical protein
MPPPVVICRALKIITVGSAAYQTSFKHSLLRGPQAVMVNGPQLMFSAAARAKTVNAVFKSDDKIDDLKVCDAKGRASSPSRR